MFFYYYFEQHCRVINVLEILRRKISSGNNADTNKRERLKKIIDINRGKPTGIIDPQRLIVKELCRPDSRIPVDKLKQ